MDLRRGTRGRTAWWPVAWATALLVVAACSGGDDAASTTSPATSASALTTPTTVADPATTPPAATSTLPPPPPPTAPATTALPTPSSAPPSTDAPGTIPPPTDEFFAELEAVLPGVMIRYIDAVFALFREPGSAERRATLASLSEGFALDVFIDQADGFVEEGSFARSDDASPATVEPMPFTLGIASGDASAGMSGCVIDTDTQYVVGPDGTEQVQDDTPDSFRMTFTFRQRDGAWIVADLVIDERFDDQIGCG